MKKTNKIFTIIAFLLVVFLISCQKAEVVGGTSVQALSNEWWVKVDGGSSASFGAGYYNLTTYNTADDSGKQMWFDDWNNKKSFWGIKGKVDVTGQNFSGTNIANQYYSSTFTITNGKVITNGAKAPGTKNVTDSIYMQISFSDETPVVTHTISGYARTRFSQDDQ